MKIFIDTADKSQIEKWIQLIDGVTTNPTIMWKDGISDIEKEIKEIATLIAPRPVSVEVTTNDLNEMVSQAQIFATWGSNIVVKIPIINADGIACLDIIKFLEEKKIKVNVTTIMSFNQIILTAKTGTTYASIFAGRVADEGNDSNTLISSAVSWLEKWGYKTEIIVGSIRGTIDVQNAALSGAHIITIPPQILSKMIDHKNTRATVNQFVEDARKVGLK